MLARAKHIEAVHKPYYHYLQRAGSIQNSGFSEKRFVILETVKLALQRMEGQDIQKQKELKDTLFLHQVLAMAMYPIREVKDRQERERLLTIFMERIFEYFPDFMETESFNDLVKWGNPLMRIYRKISLKMLKKREYSKVCSFWTVCNAGFDFFRRFC